MDTTINPTRDLPITKNRPVNEGISRPSVRRPVVAMGAALITLIGFGATSSVANAGFVPEGQVATSACEYADGYRPACSMLSGHPDGWYVPVQPAITAPSSNPEGPSMIRVR